MPNPFKRLTETEGGSMSYFVRGVGPVDAGNEEGALQAELLL
jgi:hypothetical protein